MEKAYQRVCEDTVRNCKELYSDSKEGLGRPQLPSPFNATSNTTLQVVRDFLDRLRRFRRYGFAEPSPVAMRTTVAMEISSPYENRGLLWIFLK